MPPVSRALEERFWEKVDRSGDCWIWTAGHGNHRYGMIRSGEKGSPYLLAHRVAWELSHGPIQAGLYVLHHCDTKSCVRPEHLFLGTTRDNSSDMVQKNR